ncbi:M20 family metallopeptidase [Sporolactobacillus kofuensis]|uniref:M20 family metallopeptidase n=1 Tax=Sporolactobacillus kofuensis TaxID=269672 RepID=A0ABW1WFH8_9BACL|nr:M20 family metallopeptidase [Sporolactobacillus kofuensis]MCO7174827.1 M20 family metallopeptidase [Sporolactobacillus kofuensis]
MGTDDIFQSIDQDRALFFLQSLVQINSVNPPGNERLVAEYIEEWLKNSGLDVAVNHLEDNRSNITVTLNGSVDSKHPRQHLFFSGHLDTVPLGNKEWTEEPWGGQVHAGKLYGRGSSDMKSGVAAMILALEALSRSNVQLQGDLSFLGTVGEEVDGRGARSAILKGDVSTATAMVIGEPTDNQVLIAHKGVLWLEVTIHGKTAHAGWPDKGVNAISAMHHFVSEFEKFQPIHDKILGQPTMNLGLVNGGIAPNMVADYCQMTFDMRTVPGLESEDVYRRAQDLLSALSETMDISFEIKVLNDMHYVSTAQEHPFIQLAADVLEQTLNKQPIFGGANYYSDGSLFTKENKEMPILIFGPGNPDQAHQPDEWVAINNFYDSIRFYISLALSYLGENDERMTN